ncbi:MAG: PIN domain-containing protein [Actinobacteria bacterium]|nr:PIN domain-containing protein [Actinomycetota bacterium]
MIVFVDTSALFALVDRDDKFHGAARSFFPELATRTLVTHNYVVVETIALVQARLGLAAVRAFVDDFRPLLDTVWITEEMHRSIEASLQLDSDRRISFVDRVSFELMRRRAIGQAFAFDEDFGSAGFELVPAQA